eukprot:13785020-Alexandrium_andersonii.AAC.1
MEGTAHNALGPWSRSGRSRGTAPHLSSRASPASGSSLTGVGGVATRHAGPEPCAPPTFGVAGFPW